MYRCLAQSLNGFKIQTLVPVKGRLFIVGVIRTMINWENTLRSFIKWIVMGHFLFSEFRNAIRIIVNIVLVGLRMIEENGYITREDDHELSSGRRR